MSETGKFRPEIDGLRAIAVLAVVIFHAFPRLLPGGFVGVDVFFVISGFLITRIIHTQIEGRRFSVKHFYLRRIKRILPAYTLVCIAVVVAASVLLVPDDYVYFTTSLATSWAFASNIFFSLLSGGYFSQRTETFPLLHTWSLSVEEQFYFFFPLLLILVHRISKNRLLPAVVALFLLFLGLSEYGAKSASGFFLLQYRAHELLAGALVHLCLLRYSGLIQRTAILNAATLTGIALVLYSIAMFSGNTRFPGINTLVPCVGAALILFGSGVDTASNRLLAHPPFIFIGKVSYSFYLWHWPIFAFLKVSAIEMTVPVGLAAICAALVLAYASWRFVENPVRESKLGFKPAFVYLYAVPALVFGALGAVSYQTGGLPSRFDTTLRALMATYGAERDLNRDCSIRNEDQARISLDSLSSHCQFGAVGVEPTVLLLGDSHASHFKPFLNELLVDAGLSAVYHVQGNCNSIDLKASATPGTDNESCRQRNLQLYELASRFKYVVLASNWRFREREDQFAEQLDHAIGRLQAAGVTVVVFKDNASLDIDLSRCVLNQRLDRLGPEASCHMPLHEVQAIQGRMDATIDRAVARHAGSRVVEPKKVMCNESECLTYEGDVAYYRDANHINSQAATLLGRRYLQEQGNPFRP